LFARDTPRQVSLTITTLPTDADPRSIKIARRFAANLQAVGIDAQIAPASRVTLLRDVLVNQSFDLYVARSPPVEHPDLLRSLLHSRFGAEPGWQNPFGYANLSLDDLLERQRRRTGAARRDVLEEIQRTVARTQPFTVVAFPNEIRTVRMDQDVAWKKRPLHTALSYLGL
jgi:peptide/nickel transport system substrate-binding protein